MGKRKAALAFADTSSHGNDAKQQAARRSRRNAPRRECDTAYDSDNDDIDFVEEMPALSSQRGSPDSREQRLQQRHESRDNSHRTTVHRNEDSLRQQEEDDIMRAIELSRLEMEADKRRSHSQEGFEFDSMSPLALERPPCNGSAATAKASGNSHSSKGGGAAGCFAGAKRTKSPSLSSSTSENSDGTPSHDVECASPDPEPDWQDAFKRAVKEDQFKTTGVPNIESVSNANVEDDSSVEDITEDVPNATDAMDQESVDVQALDPKVRQSKGSRMSLRKRRTLDRSPDSRPLSQHTVAHSVPEAPPCASLQQLGATDSGEEEEEEVQEVDVMNIDGEMSVLESKETDGDSPREPPVQLEVFKLVDTRKPPYEKHPYYAPSKVCKRAYTRVIYQLIQAYCSQLRQAQAKMAARVPWGKPVVTGSCYTDSLQHRRRGGRASALYARDDDDSSEDERKAASAATEPSPLRAGISSSRLRSGRQLLVREEEEEDSDFDNLLKSCSGKAPSGAGQKPSDAGTADSFSQDTVCSQADQLDAPHSSQRSSQSLTLPQDSGDTVHRSAAQSDIDEMDEFDSGPSSPQRRSCPTSKGLTSGSVESTTNNDQTDSHSSVTDIFRTHTSTYTDGECPDTSIASQMPSTTTAEADVDNRWGKRTDRNSDTRDDEDSFDERTPSPNVLGNAPLQAEDITSLSIRQNGHDENLTSPNDQDASGTASEIRKPLRQRGKVACDKEDSVPSSPVAADSSSREETSWIGADHQGLSFEEARYQFHRSQLSRLAGEVSGREEREDRRASLGDSRGREATAAHPDEGGHPESDPARDEMCNGSERLSDDIDSDVGDVHDKEEEAYSSDDLTLLGVEAMNWRDGRHGRSHGGEVGGGMWLEDDQVASTVAGGEEHRSVSNPEEAEARSLREADARDGHDGVSEEEEVAAEDSVCDTPPPMIGVECPLCAIKFPIKEIEAHASECNGPPSPQPQDSREPSQEFGLVGGRLLSGLDRIEQVASSVSPTPVRDASVPLAGTSKSGPHSHRNQVKADRKILKTARGSRAAPEDVPNSSISSMKALTAESSTAFLEENSSDSFSESADQLDATLLQLVEENQLQVRERKRARAPDNPAKRQKVADSDERDLLETDSVPTELCFLCNKQVPKSMYAEHVQAEIDRSEAEKDREDCPATPRRGLRSKMRTSGAAGEETSQEAELKPKWKASSQTSRGDDRSSRTGEPDCDSESGSSSDNEGALFNPPVSESPIRAFRPISKQPMNMIDFKNQFNTSSTSGGRAGSSSSSRHAPFKRGKRGRKRKWRRK